MADDEKVTWEYAYELIDNGEVPKRLIHVLNWRGSEHWELVSLAPRVKPVLGGTQGGDMVAVFKRRGIGAFNVDIASPPAY